MTLPPRPPTDLDCPPWCDRPPGHGYTDDGDGLRRIHTAILADLTRWSLVVMVDQTEHAAGPTGPILRHPEHVAAAWLAPNSLTGDGTACTAADLRDLAAALVHAADKLDSLATSDAPQGSPDRK